MIKKYKLVDSKQVIDFSSTYMEGGKAELGEHGYSRDRRPDKPQINFGISTGINNIPTALTIQKGNTQDKKHMKTILNIVPKVIPQVFLLIFDTGANSKTNKQRIRRMNYHYLTLKAKQVKTYKKYIKYFKGGT